MLPRAAAGALAKVLNRFSSFAPVSVIPLMSALERETGEQTQQYMLKALLPAAEWLNAVYLDTLRRLRRCATTLLMVGLAPIPSPRVQAVADTPLRESGCF